MKSLYYIYSQLYSVFEIAIHIFIKSVVFNGLFILLFAAIYIVFDYVKNPTIFNDTDKSKILNKYVTLSTKNQFLYDIEVPYPVSYTTFDFTQLQNLIILTQQIVVVVLLVYYKIHFVAELHKKYHTKII